MKSAQRIMEAARELAIARPYDKISFKDIAEKAQVHWTTVRRYFGDKEKMRQYLLEIQAQTNKPGFADTKTKILLSAERVFAKHGYEGSTLDQVAEEAGLTKGAVYWHFTSKNDLFLALTDRRLKELLTEVGREAGSIFQSKRPQEALRDLLQAQFEACERDSHDKSLLLFEFIAKHREPEMKKKLESSFSLLLKGTSQILEQYQQEEHIAKDIDADSLSTTLHALVNGIVLMWILSPESVQLSTIANDVSKVIWNGIRPQT